MQTDLEILLSQKPVVASLLAKIDLLAPTAVVVGKHGMPPKLTSCARPLMYKFPRCKHQHPPVTRRGPVGAAGGVPA